MEHNPQGLADTIRSMGGAIWQYVLVNVMGFLTHYGHVAGGAVSKVNPDSTGVNPAWRNALSIGWNEGTSASEINQMRAGHWL